MEKSQIFSKANIKDVLALTSMQEGMLFHYLSNVDSEQYLEQLCLTLSGEIDAEIIKKAWGILSSSNEVLRTVFRWNRLDKPLQIVLREYELPIRECNLSNNSDYEKLQLLQAVKKHEYSNGIDISSEPLRITIVELEHNKFEVIVTYHHILYDGWSNGILIKEFIGACNALVKGIEPINVEKNKFKEFIKWSQRQDKDKQLQYWSEYFEGYNTQTSLAIGCTKQSKQGNKKISHTLTEALSQGIYKFCKQEKTTMAALLYTTWGLLLQRYNNSKDVVFGATVSGRNAKIAGIEDMVGLFINTLPIRVKSDNDESLVTILKKVDTMLKETEDYQSSSLTDIKAYSGINSKEELFDTLLVIENYPMDKLLNSESTIKIEGLSMVERTNYKLTLAIVDFEGLKLELSYDQSLFDDNSIQRMVEHFLNIVKLITNNPEATINELDILTKEEKQQILYSFNNTSAYCPKEKALHELFEEQVEKTPNSIAISFMNNTLLKEDSSHKQLTYKELNEKSNQLARVLRVKGVKSETIVGIMAERSIEMIIGIMAILKAGGAYLPVDPQYPQDRIKYMLEDSGARVLLTQRSISNLQVTIDNCKDIECIYLDDEDSYDNDLSNLDIKIQSNDLSYVIYTSGTTGKPKGVMIEHKNISSTIQWRRDEYKLDATDNVLQLFSFSFDGFLTSFFTPIVSGAKVVILNNTEAKDPIAIKKSIANHNITHFICVPSLYSAILECSNKEGLKSLRIITLAGEKVSEHLLRQSKEKNENIEIINEYGPTESSVVASIKRNLQSDSIITIGKPIANRKLYIVNTQNQLQPQGVAGELCISGLGIARGYIKNSQLTKDKFVKCPFVESQIMYRTGDLARYLEDGNIEFLGRIDNQVKIRGFRIELGEIENKLQTYDAIKEAVVIAKEAQNSEHFLCAYYVADNDITVTNIREHLSKDLPDYMIPAYFIRLEKMPLTPNGKVDRTVLEKANEKFNTGAEYEAPSNRIEEKLVEIWQAVLGIKETIGINEDFFELGGHSLKATSFMAKVHKELNVELPLQVIFKNPTIKQLSNYINNSKQNIYSSIKPIDKRIFYPQSSAQRRLYLLNQFNKETTSYNMTSILMLEGNLDIERFQTAFKEMLRRHEILRTSFGLVDGQPVQIVQEDLDFKIDYLEVEEQAIDGIIKEYIKPFDLCKAPLLRVGIIKYSSNNYVLMTDMHHIISDGVSTGILISEFSKLYNGEELPPLSIQYRDYAVWQQEILSKEGLKNQESYWLNRFGKTDSQEEIPVLNMPTDYSRPTVQSFEGDSIDFRISRELSDKLRSIAKETQSTMYMILLSAYNVLLSKYTGQEDIVVGSPIAGRHNADLQNIIGMFVNTLAMRNYPIGDKSFTELLMEVKENCLNAYENQDYQFEELLDKLDIKKEQGRNPLFDTMFTLQNMDIDNLQLKNLKISQHSFDNKTTKFDIMLDAVESEEEIAFKLQYCTKLFKKQTMVRLSKHFENILNGITNNPQIKLKDVDMLSEIEKQEILEVFNDTKVDYSGEKMLHLLFEEQVKKSYNSTALVFGEKQLTYGEVDERANQLARLLRAKRIKADDIIAIMLDRSVEMVVGILGILKAGGAYLPIDPAYPKDRIEFMLEDSRTKILLTQEYIKDTVNFEGQTILLDDSNIYQGDKKELLPINTASNIAYVIYTSGSTGKPKGVIIEHKSAVNTLVDLQRQYPISKEDALLLKTSFTFDVSVSELFGWFLTGARLVILQKGEEKDPKALAEAIEKYNITHINFVPSMLKLLINIDNIYTKKLRGLKYVFSAGEAISKDLVKRFYSVANGVKLENLYGPTEASIYATRYSLSEHIEEGDYINVPIGKPFANTKAYILDKDNKLQPIGVPGELCLSGEGLARGYFGNFSGGFVGANPFDKDERLYRTGDLARWLEDGNIEFMGRIDHQVKIRGYRIELGEIENRLLSNKDIRQAVVLTRKSESGELYLCAYIVLHKDITILELREYLSKELPEYMIPSYFVSLDKLPITPNGKLDRKALPEPESDINTGREYEAPQNEKEEIMAKLWQEVLGINKEISVNDNFFELGGHSLKAAVLLSELHKELNIELSLKEVFNNPTIKQLSQHISNYKESIYDSIALAEKSEYYPLSAPQNRMYILNQFDKEGTNYNMPSILQLEGELNIEQFEKVFEKIINRHEALRTSFEIIEGIPKQRIHDQVEFKIEYKEAESQNPDDIIKEFIKPFDLSTSPLLKVGIVKLVDNKSVFMPKNILILDMHHIISDGVSMKILISEFLSLYRGEELPQLKIQYKDFAVWQQKYLAMGAMAKQEKYWLDRFADSIPVLDLPTDYPRPTVQSFEGAEISFSIDNKLREQVNSIAKENKATLYMVLLSAYTTLLYRYTGQEDIVVGTPIAARPHADLQNIIGMFVNTLAMRNTPTGDKTFIELLMEVKQNALRAYENQDYQFEELIEKLDIERALNKNPLFDTMFTLQNMDTEDIKLDRLKVSSFEFQNNTSKFDISLDATEAKDNISFNMQYCTKLFKSQTMERLKGHFLNILGQISNYPQLKLKDIDILTEAEKSQILKECDNVNIDFPRDKTLHQLFEQQVANTPDNVAVFFADKHSYGKQLTYSELNRKSNQLARTLREKGIKSDSIVGVLMDRCPDMIVAIIAILKAGGAYLPMDIDYPKERINFMLKDSGACALLTKEKLFNNELEFDNSVIYIDDKNIYKNESKNLTNINVPENIAYIIYTSGTTGRPKGVMIEHRNVVRLMFNDKFQFDFNSRDVWTLFHSYCFDFSVWEMYGALLCGGKLVIIPKMTARDSKGFLKILKKEKVTVLNQTPSAFYNLTNIELANAKKELKIRYVIFGGEALSPYRLHNWKEKYPKTKLINMYGITETTVHVTFKELTDNDIKENISNIGKPIPTLSTYVTDKNMKLLPIGIPGELCVGGEGVVRGYINRPELEKEKFVANVFSSNKGERLYRSGDLVKLLDNGDIEYLGRIDNQVKIRGFRIELEEIQVKLEAHEAVEEAAVIVKESKHGDRYICAYIASKIELTISDLRSHLSKYLPDYMIPTYFIQIKKLPLTSNGKVDKKALNNPDKYPQPEESINTGVEYEPPTNETEEILVGIWQDILSINEGIGINDSFFELGGHSLKATSLTAQIYKEFKVELPLHEMFKTPSIKQIAEYINNAKASIYNSIKPVEKKEHYPLSAQQRRMYILNQLDQNSTNYNMPSVMEIAGELDKQKLYECFRELIKRHESLRTSFIMAEGQPMQRVHEEVNFVMEYIEATEKDVEKIIKTFVHPFDISKAPLLKVGIIKINKSRHILITDMHHIISDGVSTAILISEFSKLYSGQKLVELRIQYKDYAVWEQELSHTEEFERQEEYWLNKYNGQIPQLDLPTDYQRPAVQSFEGSGIHFELNMELTEKLHNIAKDHRSTLFMVILATYNVLLHKYTGQEDIIVGTPIAGRSHPELQNIMGIFINTLAMRNNPTGSKSFNEFLLEVKENSLKAYENQNYQFEDLIDKLQTKGDTPLKKELGRNPLFDTMLNMRNIDNTKIELEDLIITPFEHEIDTSKFDIKLAVVEIDKVLRFTFEYSTKLFKRSTIERFIQDLNKIIEAITNNPDTKLSDIEIISEKEKQNILCDFNENLEDDF